MSDDILEILKTVPAPAMSIDPYAAMAAGHRARVRRRRLLTAAAAAAVLAVATGSVLTAGRDGAVPAQPPSTSPTPSTTPRSLTAQLAVPGQQLTASLDPAATTITIRGPGGPPGNTSLVLPVPASPGGASCRMSPALLAYACAVRAPAREGIIAYSDPTTPEVTPAPPVVGRFSIPDVSVVVVAVASPADLASLGGAAWELDDGTVADSSGRPVPQAHGRAVPVEVFAVPAYGSVYLGLRPESRGAWGAAGPVDFGGGAPGAGMGDATGDYYAWVLPAAAVSSEVLPSSGRVANQETLVLGGRKVLVAHLTGVVRHKQPSAQWLDRDGGVHPGTG